MSFSKADASLIRDALDKYSKAMPSDDVVCDLVEAANSLPMTLAVLQSTMIGKSLSRFTKKINDKDLSVKASNIIEKWRSLTEPKEPVKEEKKIVIEVEQPVVEEEDCNDNDCSPRYSVKSDPGFMKLSEKRKQMIANLAKSFVKWSEDEALYMSFLIEDAVNAVCKGDSNPEYGSKLRSLSFNLSKNEVLRSGLFDGVINADQLVRMPAKDLACPDVLEARRKAAEYDQLSRRTDIQDIAREQAMKQNGIDPNAEGDMQCSKCHSYKLVIDAKQTRSSDEPMTLFIRCLTCGRRWKQY